MSDHAFEFTDVLFLFYHGEIMRKRTTGRNLVLFRYHFWLWLCCE